MRISDWSSDVCSSDLDDLAPDFLARGAADLFHLLRHGLQLVGTVRVELAVIQHVDQVGEGGHGRVAPATVGGTGFDDFPGFGVVRRHGFLGPSAVSSLAGAWAARAFSAFRWVALTSYLGRASCGEKVC